MTDPASNPEHISEAVAKDAAARQQGLAMCLRTAAVTRVGEAVVAIVIGVFHWLDVRPVWRVAWEALVCLTVVEGLCYSFARRNCDADALRRQFGRALVATVFLAVGWSVVYRYAFSGSGIDAFSLGSLTVAAGIGCLLFIVSFIAQHVCVLTACRRIDSLYGPDGPSEVTAGAISCVFGMMVYPLIYVCWPIAWALAVGHLLRVSRLIERGIADRMARPDVAEG